MLNYLQLINSFWKLDLEYSFSPLEVAIYFRLLERCNHRNWTNPFGFACDELRVKIRCKNAESKKAFDTARNKLKQAGLIEYSKGNGRGVVTKYEIKVLQNEPFSEPLSATLSATLSELPLINNKGKPNLNKTFKEKTEKEKFEFEKHHFFLNTDFSLWWNEFLNVKKKKKASLSENALNDQFEKLKKFSGGEVEIAMEIVKRSANSGWSDLYELKKDSAQKKESGFQTAKQKRDEQYRNNIAEFADKLGVTGRPDNQGFNTTEDF